MSSAVSTSRSSSAAEVANDLITIYPHKALRLAASCSRSCSCWEHQDPQSLPIHAAHSVAVPSFQKHLSSSFSHTELAFSSFIPKCGFLFLQPLSFQPLTSCYSRLHVILCLFLCHLATSCHPFPPSFQGAHSGLVWQCLFQGEGLEGLVCSLESWSLQLLIWPLDYGTFVQQRQLCLQEPLQSYNTKVRAATFSPRSALLSPQSRPLCPLYLISWLYLARRSERHGAPVLI